MIAVRIRWCHKARDCSLRGPVTVETLLTPDLFLPQPQVSPGWRNRLEVVADGWQKWLEFFPLLAYSHALCMVMLWLLPSMTGIYFPTFSVWASYVT